MPERDIVRARALILDHGWNATCYQILNPGFKLWFSARCDAVVGYVDQGRTRVVGGSPVCPADRLSDVAKEFEDRSRRAGMRTCYFAAESRLERVYRDARDHAMILLGAQPCWDPHDWQRRIEQHASLRAQLNRASNKDVVVEEWSADRAREHPALRRCLEEWLAARGLPPLHFLIESDTLSRVFDRKVFVARRSGRITAFLVASPIPARDGWLIEQVVRGRGTVNGTSELLIDAAMHAMVAAGSTYVSLGLAPLSTHTGPARHRNPWWLRTVLRWLRAHGRRYYNFEGLEAFKAKFGPDRWEPVYAIVDDAHVGPSTLYAVASAFAQDAPARLFLRVVRDAARRRQPPPGNVHGSR